MRAWGPNYFDRLKEATVNRAVQRLEALGYDVILKKKVRPRKRRFRIFEGAENHMFDYLIVGAGFAGAVLAERLTSQLDKRVLVVEKRPHIGGNCYDCYNEHGILIHKYGPHIFHTNNQMVFEYLSQFIQWRPYQHRVLAYVEGQLVPIPINLDTINKLYGRNFSSEELEDFLEQVRESRECIKTSEDMVVSQVGRDLYEKFFRGYTRKQWGLDPSELDASVASRIPIRTNRDSRYFTDKYQCIPKEGYTKLFENMLAQPRISILLNTDYRSIIDEIRFNQLIYTGPIDVFFDQMYGPLPYRSLDFKFETLPVECYQSVATINYPNDYDFTRVTEFKHLTGQVAPHTTILREYPREQGEPYYPVPTEESKELYRRYELETKKLKSVWFVGRLATYKYYNMDEVVASALSILRDVA